MVFTTLHNESVRHEEHPLAILFTDIHSNDLLTHIIAFLNGYEGIQFSRMNKNVNKFYNEHKKQIFNNLLRNEFKYQSNTLREHEIYKLYFMKRRFYSSKWSNDEPVNVTVIPIKTKTKSRDTYLSCCMFVPKLSQQLSYRTKLTDEERYVNDILTNNVPYVLFSQWHDGSLHLLNSKTQCIERTFTGHTSNVLDVQPMWSTQLNINSNPVGMGQVINLQSQYTSSSLFNNRIITCSNDKTIRVWNMATGQSMACLTGHKSAIYNVRCTHDFTKAITCSHDKSIRFWDLQGGTCIHSIDDAHNGIIYALRFDGETTAVSCSKDGYIKVWDVRSQVQLVQSYTAKESIDNNDVNLPIYCMDFCDHIIVFSDKLGTVRFMDIRNMKILKEHEDPNKSSGSEIVLDRVKCVYVSIDNIVKVYDTSTMEIVKNDVKITQRVNLLHGFCLSMGNNPHIDDQYMLTSDSIGSLCLLNYE
jgi:WD40 repeat protein